MVFQKLAKAGILVRKMDIYGIKNSLRQVPNQIDSIPFPGFTFSIHTFLSERIEETGSGYVADFVIEVIGLDSKNIDKDAKNIALLLDTFPYFENIKIIAPLGSPQIKISLKHENISERGLNSDEINKIFEVIFRGIHVAEIIDGERKIPISINVNKEYISNINKIKNLNFVSISGVNFKISDVAIIEFGHF